MANHDIREGYCRNDELYRHGGRGDRQKAGRESPADRE
jgi:hypothetical protein